MVVQNRFEAIRKVVFHGITELPVTTGTAHLLDTAPVDRLNNGGTEHGPLGLYVPCLPPDIVEAFPEAGVQAASDRGLCQILTIHSGLPGLTGILLHHRS